MKFWRGAPGRSLPAHKAGIREYLAGLQKLRFVGCIGVAALALAAGSARQADAQTTQPSIWNGYQGATDVTLNFASTTTSGLYTLGVDLTTSGGTPDGTLTLQKGDEWTVDTGSTGVVISASDLLSDYGIDYHSLESQSLGPGKITYSSSGLSYTGFYVMLNLGLYNATTTGSTTTGTLGATAEVPVLIATEQTNSSGTATSDFSIEQFGIGFGRGSDADAETTTSNKNPLLNLTSVATGSLQTMAPGYVVSNTGIQLGLTPAQLQDTAFSGLLQTATSTPTALTNSYAVAATQTNWDTPAATITITNAGKSSGDGTLYGSLLVDTGISNIEISTGASAKGWDPRVDTTDPSQSTNIEIYLPGAASTGQPVAYSLLYQGDCDSAKKDSCPKKADYELNYDISPVYPVNSHNAPTDGFNFVASTKAKTRYPFINTGDQFLNYFNIIYDPVDGFFGYQTADPSATPAASDPVVTESIALQGPTPIPGGTVVTVPTLLFDELIDGYSSGEVLVPVQLSSPGQVTLAGVMSSAVICAPNNTNCAATPLEISSGDFTLTADNDYIGATQIDPGASLALAGAGSIAASAGVADNGTFDISNTTAGATITTLVGTGNVQLGGQALTESDASGSFGGMLTDGGLGGGTGGSLVIAGGMETLTGTNRYTGATIIEPGATLALGGSGSIAESAGVLADGTFDISNTAGASIASLSGTGNVILGSQMLTLSNASGTFAGTIDPGSVAVTGGTEDFAGTTQADLAVADGAGAANSGVIDGDVVNAGVFMNAGTINGDFVNTNVLINTGTLSGMLTNAGILSGTGTVGGLAVSSGAIVEPGGLGIGSVVVNGNVNFAPGSAYLAILGAPGISDLISAQGTATINGATLDLMPGQGFSPIFGAQYTLLTAQGGVLGNFALAESGLNLGTPSSALPFLGIDLANRGTAEEIMLTRSAVPFTSFTQTPNQTNAAAAADSLGTAAPLTASLAGLTGSETPAAFTSLAGEIYPSLQSVLLAQSSFVRGAVEDRLRQATGGAPAGDAAIETAPLASTDATLWEQTYGGWDNLQGNADAAPVTSSIGGFMMGVDEGVGAWRVGAAGGFGQSGISATAIASSGTSNNYDFAAYAGRSFASAGPGTWALRLGTAYSRNGLSVQRNVVLPDFHATYSPGYVAQTGQVFGEIAYGMFLPPAALRLEPFAGLSYAGLASNSFSEGAGAAALTAQGSNFASLQSTLGARAALPMTLGRLPLTLSGLLGWLHGYGNLTPSTRLAFAGDSVPFTAYGVPLASNALLAGVSISGTLGSTEVSLTYSGQITPNVINQNALNGTLSWRF